MPVHKHSQAHRERERERDSVFGRTDTLSFLCVCVCVVLCDDSINEGLCRLRAFGFVVSCRVVSCRVVLCRVMMVSPFCDNPLVCSSALLLCPAHDGGAKFNSNANDKNRSNQTEYGTKNQTE